MKILPYIQIARPGHWFKNIFMAPGIILVIFFEPSFWTETSTFKVILGLISACIVASSNYVLNEILDVKNDKFHPEKKFRPIPKGEVRISAAYTEWIILSTVGLSLGFALSLLFGLSVLSLWCMGVLYNVPPVRLKEFPYADVLSESVNNPIRLAMGWYSTGYLSAPPLSILLAYWMFGAFLMAMKRFAEYRTIGDHDQAGQYRSSFGYYNDEKLLESIIFYGTFFGMLSGVFIVRYHIELVLATPLVAYAMAYYMHLGFKTNSPVQNPEKLYKQKKLMVIVTISFLACAILLLVKIQVFRELVYPWQLPPDVKIISDMYTE